MKAVKIKENYEIPKKLLKTEYRREMWKNVVRVVTRIEKVLPISSMHLVGSFTSEKRRPADVDFVVLLHTPKQKKRNWSVDLMIAPDNKHGKWVLEDCAKWMKQKYGSKKSMFLKLK